MVYSHGLYEVATKEKRQETFWKVKVSDPSKSNGKFSNEICLVFQKSIKSFHQSYKNCNQKFLVIVETT